MAIIESPSSRKEKQNGKSSTQQRVYSIIGVDRDDVDDLLADSIPASVSVDGFGLTDRSIKIDPVDGYRHHTATVDYRHTSASKKNNNQGQPESPNDDSVYSFDFQGETHHITQAVEDQKAWLPGVNQAGVSEFEKDINVVGPDREVRGVDIIFPRGVVKITKVFSKNVVTQEWVSSRSKMVGKTNANNFLGYEKEELLFSEFSGTRTGDDDWRVTFGFAVSETEVVDINIYSQNGNPTLTNVEKIGWHYLWARREDIYNSNDDVTANRITSVHTAKVYKTFNGAALI